MWVLWAVAAVAATVTVVVPEGELRPGTPGLVHLVVTDEEGHALGEAPAILPGEARARPVEEQPAPGVWAWQVIPPHDAEAIDLRVEVAGERHEIRLPVEPAPVPGLVTARQVMAVAGGDPVMLRVEGPDLPPPEALQVLASEGVVQAVKQVGDHLEVVIATDEDPMARLVPVGLRDARGDGRPVWTVLILRARVRLSYETEPGTTLRLALGQRAYGPFTADEQGRISAWVDQWPGETTAQAVFTDQVGNETRAVVPLAPSGQASLLALPTGPVIQGRPLPAIYLRALGVDGRPWTGAPPTCRAPAVGELVTQAVEPGTFLLVVPEVPLSEPRLRCTLGDAAELALRLPAGEQVAAALQLRVWPEEISTDFPVADVQATLEDGRGERMLVDGVRVWAERGEVSLEGRDGMVLRGEYRGARAVDAGRDALLARFDLPPGEGPVARLVPSHEPVPEGGGPFQVHARALDASGRPLAGVLVALILGEATAEASTGEDGWASATLDAPDVRSPLVLEARSGQRVGRALVLRRGQPLVGPGTPDLGARREVRLTPGRVARVDLQVEPTVLYTGPGAVARVRVAVVDRAGQPVAEPPELLQASEGTLGPLRLAGDGMYVADFHPPPGDRPRSVRIQAQAEHASGAVELLLEPRPLDRAPGVAVGAITNLGAIASPYVSADFDLRAPWFDGRFMVRLGVGWYVAQAQVPLQGGPDAVLRMSVAPVTLGLLARGEESGRAQWVGLGGVLAPYRAQARIGDELAGAGVGVFTPGLAAIGGAGRRVRGGEVFLELRGLALSSPGGAAGFQGPVGGLVAVLGYRVGT